MISATGAGATDHTITLHDGPAIPAASEGVSFDGDSFDSDVQVASFTDSTVYCDDISSNAAWHATIDWGDGSDPSAGNLSCSSHDFAVYGNHEYLDSGTPAGTAFPIKVTVKYIQGTVTITAGPTQTDSVKVADAGINSFGPVTKSPASPITEGTAVTLSALFIDRNQHGSDVSGMSASVSWPDGSTSAGTVQDVTSTIPLPVDGCCLVYKVTAVGTPDAGMKNDEPTITLHDDGGSSRSTFFSLTVNDAALTKDAAKSFVAPNGQVSNAVVASFTDAAKAQAKAADFAASIKWGDGTTSAGSLTRTADGAFNVNGTHSYATAGTKSVTITATDEEGQVLAMTATITVPPLPLTGQPTPAAPGLPLPLIGIVLGLMAIAFGTGQLLLRRLRS